MDIIAHLSEIPPDLIEFFEPVDSHGAPPDVMKIAAEPLREKHYAAFPSELVLRCVRAGTSSRGYCPACGMPWCRVVETKFYGSHHDHSGDGSEYGSRQNGAGPIGGDDFRENYQPPKTLDWRPSCTCPSAMPRPGVVLDPFMGSGRTLITARRLGLDVIGCELNPSYVEMARRLLRDDSPLFNGLGKGAGHDDEGDAGGA